jgi:hypothetical protein
MSSACSPRIRPWRVTADGKGAGRRRGAVSLVVVFLTFVFSGLGLSLICLSQAFMRMNAYRKFTLLADYASENGLKRGLGDLADWIQAAEPVVPVPEALLADFHDSPATGFAPLIEACLPPGFPRRLAESGDGMSWESLATCGLRRIEDRGDYLRIDAALRIESSGTWSRLPQRQASSLDASLGILAGRLPLPSVPLLIGKDMTEAERKVFLENNGISFLDTGGGVLAPAAAAAGAGLIPTEADGLVAKALGIHLLSPQDLSASKLREVLGLEASEEPVPDGVYLIQNDMGLGGVFVQGDADEMILAISGDAQVVAFRQAEGEWRLEFSPARGRTEFRTPEAAFAYDFVPLGLIIVNGKILSLGGGVVDAGGAVRLVTDPEVPSVLGGVSLTIVSSDRITLTSHLILQGVRWQEGIPCLKDSQDQLVIFSTGRDVLSGEERDGGIAVGADAPDELKLHASLTSGNGEFEIDGSGKTVQVLGAVHAAGYSGHGNSLQIAPDGRFAGGDLCENAPATAVPRFSVYSLKVLAWRED